MCCVRTPPAGESDSRAPPAERSYRTRYRFLERKPNRPNRAGTVCWSDWRIRHLDWSDREKEQWGDTGTRAPMRCLVVSWVQAPAANEVRWPKIWTINKTPLHGGTAAIPLLFLSLMRKLLPWLIWRISVNMCPHIWGEYTHLLRYAHIHAPGRFLPAHDRRHPRQPHPSHWDTCLRKNILGLTHSHTQISSQILSI